LCLAFIRYHHWLSICEDDLKDEAPRFVRHDPTYAAHTFLFIAQPLLAYIGLIGSIVVIAFASANSWTTKANPGKYLPAYMTPIVLFVSFLLLKVAHKRLFKKWWVYLNPDVTVLITELNRLERSRPVPRSGRKDEDLKLSQTDHATAATVSSNPIEFVPVQQTAYPTQLNVGNVAPEHNGTSSNPSPHTQQQQWNNVWR
jgi:hypothetical protein